MKKFLVIIFCCSCQITYSQINCTNWLKTASAPSSVRIGQLNIPEDKLTIEAVINRTTPYQNGQVWAGDIVSKHRDPTDANYILRPNSGEITTSNGYYKTPDILDIELNKTHHVAMVYDGSTLKFYRDGCLMSQIPASGPLVQNSWETSIGYYSPQLFPAENFIGYINEVRIWNVARTQDEIRTYMNTSLPNPTAQKGLLAYYIFNNLSNKQGDPKWNGTLNGSASIKETNPACNAIISSCLPPANVSNVINEYTEVIDFDVCKNELTVSDASKYNAGDTVLIIQMKGAEIDLSNTQIFGTVTDYKNSGNYEFNIIKEKSGNKIVLLNILERQYDIPNGLVQLIRVPFYDKVNVTSTLTCLPWNGSKGGVLAFNANNSVTMNADIDVSGKGFRHGAAMNSTLVTINEQGYFYDLYSNRGAQKGEGIHVISNNVNYGRGASSNGGGGGNGHNTGGGGGGNGGIGGNGGDQWETGKTISENVGGKGGRALKNSTALNKLYLGGSGGMGQANDFREFPAGNGGGIIIFSTNTLTSNNFSIKSNGDNAIEAPNSAECKDGMAGGGAGGSILLDVNNITGQTNVEAHGGKGADHLAQNVLHGPGGGGGGGVIALAQITTPAQYNFNLKGGLNGVNIYHSNDPWGATAGSAGAVFNNFKPYIDQITFKKNIDSLKINETMSDCYSFDFKGLAFVSFNPVTSWSWAFGDGNTSSFQNPTHTFSGAGTYDVKLVATDINGCRDSVTKAIITSDIKITKSADTALCGSSPVKIFANGGSTYLWTPSIGLDNPNISSPVATPKVSTKYYVTVTHLGGCSKIDSVSITVNNLPVVGKSNDTTVCKNSDISLFASGGVSYSWIPVNAVNNPAIANPIATVISNTTYFVKVTNIQGCSIIDSIKLKVNPVPAITKSKDSTVCKNNPVKLFVSGGSSYLWSPASSLDDPYSSTPVALPLSTTTYQVRITDAKSCIYNDSVKVSIRDAAVFSVSPNSSVCENTSQELLASGGSSYVWSPSSFLSDPYISNPVAVADTTILYSVKITDNVCNESATLYTKLTVLPAANVQAFKSNDITCAFPSSQLNATGAESYAWTPATDLNNSNIADPTATPRVSTTYLVTGKDSNGCIGTDTISINVGLYSNVIYELPNSFTPNGDGINDCFGVAYWGVLQKLNFSIFNRFGERVFYTNNSAVCWDGKYKGNLQDSNVFVYILHAKVACGIIERKGTVMLLK